MTLEDKKIEKTYLEAKLKELQEDRTKYMEKCIGKNNFAVIEKLAGKIGYKSVLYSILTLMDKQDIDLICNKLRNLKKIT